MHTIQLIPARNTEEWCRILNQTDGFDFYHLPEYQLLAEAQGEGEAFLLCYAELPLVIAWPLLFRRLETIEGLDQAAKGLRDTSSAYGYPGPVLSSAARNDEEFLRRFGIALKKAAKEMNLVCMFSRMHPLLNDPPPEIGIGSFVFRGKTVSIDLTEREEIQWARVRKNHRTNIRKAKHLGVMVRRDSSRAGLEEFVRLYSHTMVRVDAEEFYLFDSDYFSNLQEALGERLLVFLAEHERQTCSAGLFTKTGPIIQYHLSGSNHEFRKLAGFKLIVDEVRRWGKGAGATVLHLGGGVACKEDSLFHFKAGFSPIRHRFFTWQYLVEPVLYWSLVERRMEFFGKMGLAIGDSDYFPLYRAKGVPSDDLSESLS